jgi:hypothetical protein
MPRIKGNAHDYIMGAFTAMCTHLNLQPGRVQHYTTIMERFSREENLSMERRFSQKLHSWLSHECSRAAPALGCSHRSLGCVPSVPAVQVIHALTHPINICPSGGFIPCFPPCTLTTMANTPFDHCRCNFGHLTLPPCMNHQAVGSWLKSSIMTS